MAAVLPRLLNQRLARKQSPQRLRKNLVQEVAPVPVRVLIPRKKTEFLLELDL